MKVIKFLLSIFIVALGVFMFVYAGYDDSPGGQLIGVVVVGLGLAILFKSIGKTK
ncbi:MAG: hypothetical protein ACPGO5_01245 [Patescibacteria group bacterium]